MIVILAIDKNKKINYNDVVIATEKTSNFFYTYSKRVLFRIHRVIIIYFVHAQVLDNQTTKPKCVGCHEIVNNK